MILPPEVVLGLVRQLQSKVAKHAYARQDGDRNVEVLWLSGSGHDLATPDGTQAGAPTAEEGRQSMRMQGRTQIRL
jgi:hypothetical protein